MALPFYTGQVPTADDFNALMPKADLSASSGSSLVGYSQGGTNAVERTVEEKLREIVTPIDFGAVGDGVTDDKLALQRCFNYAMSVGAEVFLLNKTYAISGKLFLNGAKPIYLHDGYLKALEGTWGVGGTAFGAMLDIQRPSGSDERHNIYRINLDCNYQAFTGFYIYRIGARSGISNCHCVRFKDYGFWIKATADGNNDLVLDNCSAAEATFTDTDKFNDYSLRTGVAFYNDTSADVTLSNCRGSASKHAIKVSGDFWNFAVTGGQYWNGNSRTEADSVTVLIDADVKRCKFVGVRFDDGSVNLYSFNHQFSDCLFIQYQLNPLQLVATAVNETAKQLSFIGNKFFDDASPVALLTEGVGTWGEVAAEWIGNKNTSGSTVAIQNKTLITDGLVIENGDVTLTGDVYIDGTKVVGPQEAGWTAATGTPNKGAYATYAGQTASAGYVQAEAQATDDATKANSQRIKAIEDALRTHGLIN